MRRWLLVAGWIHALAACGGSTSQAANAEGTTAEAREDETGEANEPSAEPAAEPAAEPSAEPAARPQGESTGYDAALAAVRSQTPRREQYRLEDGTTIVMYRWESPRLIVSESCAPGGVLGTCAALDAIRALQTIDVEVGPGNPSSYYCPAAGGENVRATTEGGGESGLCRFTDGSYAANWSLVYVPAFGRENRATQ